MPSLALILNFRLFFELCILGTESTNNPKGLRNELWRFRQFRIRKREEKIAQTYMGRSRDGAPYLR